MSLTSRKNFLKLLSSRAITIVLLIFIALIGFALARDYQKQNEIRTELTAIEDEISALENKNLELVKLVDVLESSNYIEQEARQRLGLKKEGETVVSIPENARPLVREEIPVEQLEGKSSNAKQWFNYFFSPDSQ